MGECTSCHRKNLPSEAFVYENKTYKTCTICKAARAGKASTRKNASADNVNSEETPVETIFIEEISNHIADLISGLEHDEMLSSTFHVKLDEATLCAVGTNVGVMAKLIVDEIEEGDDFKWIATTAPNLSTRYQGIGNAYFACSQSDELKREYKESNRIRIDRFNCGGKLNINIDIPAKEAKVVLKHKLIHNAPVDVTTPPEIKQEIMDNLNMDPVLNEFSFVDPSFKPDLQREDKEYYVVLKESESQNIRLIFSNFKRRTDYPFLIWDGSEAQDIPMILTLPNLMSHQTDTENNVVEEIEDKNRRQEVETKIAALNRLVEHLNIELAANNLRHVESV
ncbi:4702_t:CDS:2, partial [Cetraspora pellucida]